MTTNNEKRYRATIYVDLWCDKEGKGAAKELEKIVKSIPNSFSDGLEKLHHGSEISITEGDLTK